MKLQGIYFKIEDNQITYVGKTTNLANRLQQHKYIKDNDTYKFLPIANKSDMALLELAFIDLYKPKYNKLDKFDGNSSITIELPNIDELKLHCNAYAINRRKTKTYKGRTMVVHPSIPFSQFLVLRHSGKEAPVIKRSIQDTLEEVNNVTIASKYLGFFKENTNEFLVIKAPLTRLVQDWFKVNINIAKRFTKEFVASDIIRKLNNTTYVVNPYVIWYFGLSNDKHYILQSHWTYRPNEEISDWCLLTEEEQHQFNKQVVDSLEESTTLVVGEYKKSEETYDTSTGLFVSDMDKLSKAKSDDISNLIYRFTKEYKGDENLDPIEGFKVAITMLTNDTVVRKFYSWYKKNKPKLGEELQFNFIYKNRKKVVTYLLKLGAEVKSDKLITN